MKLDNYRKTLVAAFGVLAAAFCIGIFALGKTVTQGQYWITTAVFAVAAAIILFVVFRNSKASVEGEYHGVKFSASGALAGALLIGAGLHFTKPGPESISVNFMVTQVSGLYKEHCLVEYQIGSGSRIPVAINDGATTIGGVPPDTSTIKIWDVSAYGKSIIPLGKIGNPPWNFPLDDGNNISISLSVPTVKECTQPSIEDLRRQLKKDGVYEAVASEYASAKTDSAREQRRKKAVFKVMNMTEKKIDIVGLDYRKLFEQTDGLSLEDEDWLDFFEFNGQDYHQEIPFDRLKEMKFTSGLFFLYACVPTPEGHTEVYLGHVDLLSHDLTRYKLATNGSESQPIVLQPNTESNP